MPLASGTRLGPYEIRSLLGTGGMGEVYQAADTKLSRDVALKLLPEQFGADPDRLARFQREAQLLAQLNHPNIATIHGLEESGSARALVMELVEGPTLADRVAEGPMPFEEALTIAKQIAEALEYAHQRGIIHRDLKPANVKLTRDGKAKVLDFGLAKAMSDEASAINRSNSPTISLGATQAGIILGTAAYMSPEQAKGKTVDLRGDIWSFGVVLFEMLTGRQLFPGETASESMALVIARDPDWSVLPSNVPQRIRELLRRCLTKDPGNRLQAIGDARIVIDEVIAHPELEWSPPVQTTVEPVPRRWRHAIPWAIVAVLGLALIVALVALKPGVSPVSRPLRLNADLGLDIALDTSPNSPAAAISPDGSLLVFVGRKTGQRAQLYVRRFDQLQASVLSGSDGARDPFFSPDGRWVGFFADSKLKKTSVAGGGAVTLCDALDDRGGTWGDDGNIIFAPAGNSPLFRVSSAGGKPETLTKFEKVDGDTMEVTHRWPRVLPGSRALLLTSNTTLGIYDNALIVVQSLETGERKILQHGGYDARYLPTGHIVYVHESTLFAVPFDLKRLDVTGQPVPVIEGVTSYSNTGAAQIAFSNDGAVAYQPGTILAAQTSFSWMTHEGSLTPLYSTPGSYWNPRFSPDGRRLAIDMIMGSQRDIWVYDLARNTISRMTFGPLNRYPTWTPDGRRIAFSSPDNSLAWQRADGTGEIQKLTDRKNFQIPDSFHPSGKFLAFSENNLQTGYDLMILPIDGDESSGWKPGKPTPFLTSPFAERWARFSPDGRWLAYSSNESGRPEVYVRPFPGPGGKWQISSGGGNFPGWSQTRKELLYRAENQNIMVSSYTTEADSFRADQPKVWSSGQFIDRGLNNTAFDLHPDGQRFAVIKSPEGQAGIPDKLVFVFNFFDELRRIAPGK